MTTQNLIRNVQLRNMVNAVAAMEKSAADMAADADTLPLTQKNIADAQTALASLSTAINAAVAAPAAPAAAETNTTA